ncbi:ABC transporter ATP-binding protein [Histidinibacterium aquaticum]|uniref:ATP-binding cassette domain-containing protein n=1 Tax=Histidinibacterium aquaticum TaxID=2613962 RepID=A0A5J5GMT8_9RHOB|nr:oligopeptide/dipeptide ABC transporter ATP-binding protein [Histidinibacterium aquaticum]KAA9008844.1 ATP-binding cassette domain-containing protein [Histidinibacterium aquaticum]
MTALIRLERLTRDFDVSKPWLNRVIERLPRETLRAVSDVSLEIPAGSVYALVGESGSGKSTIGRIVAGLVRASGGTVEIDGVDTVSAAPARVSEVRRELQMIFQDPFASLNPRWKVRRIIAEPVAVRGESTEGLSERLLEQVGLSAADANKYPHEFSGGQRQRICIARALASNPKIIICDEPTSALDVSVQSQVLNLMSDLREELGLTYLFISHDLTVVQHMADRIGVLYLGALVEEAPRDRLFAEPKHPYTQMLFDAAPRMDAFGREVEPPKGEIPDAINPPPGCPYHPRCPMATEVCWTEVPQTRHIGETRVRCHHAE